MARIVPVLALACLAGTISLSAQMKHVDLKDAKGTVVGMVMISPIKGGGVSIDLDVKGLKPGAHALRFLAVPKCEAPFTSAGGPFTPANKTPGAGDPMSFTVAANGTARTTITNTGVTMGAEPNSMYANGGTALMIYAGDAKTEAAGSRIVCGAITK